MSPQVPGSSPLTRGKLAFRGDVPPGAGLIPAHAGKTSSLTDRQTPRRAHPRSRGENVTPCYGLVTALGSSPLTRGKRFSRTASRNRAGLIPAHAGKTIASVPRSTAPGAHPRSRGENWHHVVGFWAARGSSPLTRGKLHVAAIIVRRVRLIPAHAGKTRCHRHGGPG